MIYIVLGMHKSGTTAISQILHHSGINMVDDAKSDMSYEQGNQYERESTKAVNMDVLDCEGLFSLKIEPPTNLAISSSQRDKIKSIINNSEKFTDWGFKDPRTCLTYPVWRTELPEHKIIVVYRSIDEMWQRYRDKSVRKKYRFPHAAWLLVKRWCEYNSRIVDCLQQTSLDFIVLDYQSFMRGETELDRLQNFVGKPLNDKRDKSLYHHYPENSQLLKIATAIVHRQTGYCVRDLVTQLELLK